MPAMSVPAQQKPNSKRTGKRITFFSDQGPVMKEATQNPEGSYFGLSGPASEPGQSEAASTVSSNPEAPHMYLNSVIFSPDKGDQSRGHYQQTVPMKWAHQEPGQTSSQPQQQRAVTWTTNWGQNFVNYLGVGNVTDTRGQTSFAKSVHEPPLLQPQAPNRAPDKPPLAPSPAGEAYRDAAKPRSVEWEQQPQSQAFQHTLKPGALNAQQHGASNPGGSSVLQPFQLAFGQPKPHLANYYQAFQASRTALPNMEYQAQAKAPHQLQQMQKQEQVQRQQQQQQQQQHILQQQQLQQQQQQHQMQQQQILQHQHHVQQLQQQQQIQREQQKKLQQQQQQQVQQQMQHQQLQQQNPRVLDYCPGAQNAHPPPHPQPPTAVHSRDSSPPAPPKHQEPLIQDITPEPQPPAEPLQPSLQALQPQGQAPPRRSRRLSKEGGAPSDNPFLVSSSSSQAGPGPQGCPNGAPEVQAAPTGVIQSTRRKRRVSQEANLETLAQKASEMESLPPHIVKEPHRPWSPTETEGLNSKRHRDDSLMPLVIPVSVPVRRPGTPPCTEQERAGLGYGWPPRPHNIQDLGRDDHKPSVIVTRRRSLRNSLSESSGQNGGAEGERDDDGKKFKRRRPEPLFIPPPKAGVFIAPPIYSSITPYQSHLRSPVRLVDNPLAIPPYTPPPILSPVREGSGLYFSTFLSAAAAAASGQGLAPPATPKSATRSLLRTNSCDITPPVLSAMGEATPVSIEPRINIGSRYQAEVPELRQRADVHLDEHRAKLVWAPAGQLEARPDFHEKVEALMHLACSSAMSGGGTNQELAHHCLHECNGDIMAALSLLMLKNPIFSKSHHLSDYHYSGSDSWTAAERRQFNKGITNHKKDFFMVQTLVSTKTVAQCVEFYYTYKKHVKIGRNGTLLYGEAEPVDSRTNEDDQDHKGSQILEARKDSEDSRKWEGSGDRKRDVSPARVTQTLQATESDSAGTLVIKGQEDMGKDQPLSRVIHLPQPPPPTSTATSKPRYDNNARKPTAASKPPAAQEGEFPCKKCGRVFYKVKSRSAHMKSHAEQEKKAAALRQREAEERAAMEALAAHHQNGSRQGAGECTNDSATEGEEDWQ